MFASLSYDGRGLNGTDEYRTRLATFASREAAQQYGPIFAAAPAMLAALRSVASLDDPAREPIHWAEALALVRAAIAQAEGRA